MELALDRLSVQDEAISHFFFPAMAVCKPRASLAAEGVTYDPLVDDEEPIRIPDTILYSFGKPICWLYYDEPTRSVKRRPHKALNTAAIVDLFSSAEKSSSRLGIMAWFYKAKEEDQPDASGSNHQLQQQASKKGGNSSFESSEQASSQTSDFPYDILTQEEAGRSGLMHFVQVPKVKGVLQHYVENRPQSDGSLKNVFITCMYSPSYFRVEQHVSRHTLVGPEAAASGLRLSEMFSPFSAVYDRRPLVSSVINIRLHRLCTSIARRLKRTLDYTVASLTVMCRMDSKDQIYVSCVNGIQAHSPRRFPGYSFRLTPLGTTRLVYSVDRRGGGGGGGGGASVLNASVSSRSRSLVVSAVQAPHEGEGEGDSPTRIQWQASGMQKALTIVHDAQQAAVPMDKTMPSALSGSITTSRHAAAANEQKRNVLEHLFASIYLEGGPSFFGSDHACFVDEDAAHVVPRCVVCGFVAESEAALCKMAAKWPIFWMSPINGGERGGESLEMSDDDIPTSVGLVFPNLSVPSFHALVANDKEGCWLNKPVRVCERCVVSCSRANEFLCTTRARAPSWMHLDDVFETGAAKALAKEKRSPVVTPATRAALQQLEPSSCVTLPQALFSTSNSRGSLLLSRGPMSDASVLATPCEVVLPQSRALRDATPGAHQHTRRRDTQQVSLISRIGSGASTGEDGLHVSSSSFQSAVRADPLACDLYRKDPSKGIWKKAGFGKPTPLPFLFTGPYESATLKTRGEELLSKLNDVARSRSNLSEDCWEGFYVPKRSNEVDGNAPPVPCGTPR